MLLMPVTKSSRGLSPFALSENYLFTQEAFADYHRHLTERGSLLLMTHNMPEAVKFMTTALEVLQGEGATVEQTMSHVYILGSDMMPLFGMSKTALSPEQSEALHAAVHSGKFSARYSYVSGVAQKLLQAPLTTSIDSGSPMMNPLFMELAAGRLPLERLERGAGFDFAPATDDRPFFFQFTFGLPAVLWSVLGLALAALAMLVLVPGYRIQNHSSPQAKQFTWLARHCSSQPLGLATL
jgi:hypothetical protein